MNLPRFLPAAVALLLLAPRIVNGEADTGDDLTQPLVTVDWTPPETSIPREFVDTVKGLLGNGLSDPRGGEFHKVKVPMGDAAWSEVQDREMFGWILPGGKQVVLIDGLVYAVAQDLGPISEYKPEKERDWQNQPVPMHPESAIAALLLIRGETLTAESFYKGLNEAVDARLFLYEHLFARYKMQVAQCLKDRDYSAALPFANALARVAKLRKESGLAKDDHEALQSIYVLQPPQLLADIQRRVDNPKPPADIEAVLALPENQRTPAYIEALDEVAAMQWGQPGGLDWFRDPIIGAAPKLGETAIPALIDAMEKDQRFTRSVSFHRDFSTGRDIHRVREAAWRALVSIWPSAEAITGADSPQAVTKLRESWAAVKSLSPMERWLNVLRDDKAGVEAWLEAAEALTEPAGTKRHGQWITMGEGPGLTGDVIRAQHGQEITALLIKRADSIKPEGETEPMGIIANGNAASAPNTADPNYSGPFPLHVDMGATYDNRLKLVRFLAKWDPAASLDALQTASQGMKSILDQPDRDDFMSQESEEYGRVLSLRLKNGDRGAVADFAYFVARLHPDEALEVDILRPLWKFPDDKEIQDLGTAHLGLVEKRLTAIKIDEDEKRPTYELGSVADSPLLFSPAFRDFLARVLRSDLRLGTANLNEDGDGIEYDLESSSGSGGLPRGIKPDGLTREKVDVTLGDFTAAQFDSFEDAPPFLLIWPRDKREEARKNITMWLLDPNADWAKRTDDQFYGRYLDD